VRQQRLGEAAGVGHKHERDGAEDGADEEVRTAAAEWTPSAVAHRADERLDDQAGQRRGEPETRDLFVGCAEVLVDRTHVRHLQPPAELDAEEPEVHVPEGGEGEGWFGVHGVAANTKEK